MPKITTFLTYVDQAEQAAEYYVSIFPNSRITSVTRYCEGAPAPQGSAMTVTFELDGQEYVALNGGPHFKFTDAVSLSVDCTTQDEIDHYWHELSAGGETAPCGWVKDRFGLWWQVNPRILGEMLSDPDPAKARRAMQAMLGMTKIDIAALRKAFESP